MIHKIPPPPLPPESTRKVSLAAGKTHLDSGWSKTTTALIYIPADGARLKRDCAEVTQRLASVERLSPGQVSKMTGEMKRFEDVDSLRERAGETKVSRRRQFSECGRVFVSSARLLGQLGEGCAFRIGVLGLPSSRYVVGLWWHTLNKHESLKKRA